MWFDKLIRQFFFALDSVIYRFIPIIYDLLIKIAKTSILSQADILDMSKRIYNFLAIFMTFKIAFSLITYIVNPDDFSDKNKGLGKLGTNVIISLSLLILTPFIFNQAYRLQTIILEDNSIATLVFGKELAGDMDKNPYNTAGESMAYVTISAFFTPNLSLEELKECNTLLEETSTGEMAFNEECSGLNSNNESTGNDNSLYGLTVDNDYFTERTLKSYVAGVSLKNTSLMFRKNMALATDKDNENFIIEYKIVFSTAVGVIVILILVGFCMDVAARSIKLSFLQLIAPIPILSYVDPKSGKDGLFKKWYEMCFKTFLSLFVRILALCFSVYIISKVADHRMVDMVDGAYQTNAIIEIFIIIGALMFAKQLPKILEGLGIKLDGDGKFFLNPFKKFGEQALGGKQLLGLGAAGAAAGLAGLTNFGSRLFDKNNWKDKNGKVNAGSILKGLGRTAGSTIAGTTGTMYRGISKTAKGEKPGKIFANSYGEAMFAKLQREDLGRRGSTFIGRVKADAARLTGNLNAAQRQTLALAELDSEYKNKTEKIKADRETLKQEKAVTANRKNEEIKTHSSNHKNLESINKRIMSTKGISDAAGAINVKDLDEQINNMKAAGTFYVKEGEKFTDANGVVKVATKDDVANLVKSDTGKVLDDKLNVEKDRALKYLLNNDAEVKERATILKNEGGIDVSTMSAKDVKTTMIDEGNAEEAVNAKYYTIEQTYSEREKKLDENETTLSEEYKAEIEKAGLDKTSDEWIANEADNASRKVKSPQQEGWKPSESINSSSYVYNPRLGGTPGPGPGPRGPRP